MPPGSFIPGVVFMSPAKPKPKTAPSTGLNLKAPSDDGNNEYENIPKLPMVSGPGSSHVIEKNGRGEYENNNDENDDDNENGEKEKEREEKEEEEEIKYECKFADPKFWEKNLYLICSNNNSNDLDLCLMNKCPINYIMKDHDNETPLLIGCRLGLVDIVATCLDKNADLQPILNGKCALLVFL